MAQTCIPNNKPTIVTATALFHQNLPISNIPILLKTAVAQVDEGPFMSSQLAKKLRISSKNINISAFGAEPPSIRQLGIAMVDVGIPMGELQTV